MNSCTTFKTVSLFDENVLREIGDKALAQQEPVSVIVSNQGDRVRSFMDAIRSMFAGTLIVERFPATSRAAAVVLIQRKDTANA